MDGLHIFLVVLLGVVSYSHSLISGSVLEVTVRPGDNITLFCDCKMSAGVFIVWYRNCSHENQPSLVLKLNKDSWKEPMHTAGYVIPLPRFHFVKNSSSDSYDLLIINITDSDEGLYYCGTEQKGVDSGQYITHRYGNVTTRIQFNSTDSSSCLDSSRCSDVSWMMMFTPALTILSSFISFIFIYHICQKTAKEPQVHQKRPDTSGQTRQNQGEDVFLTRVVFWVQDG